MFYLDAIPWNIEGYMTEDERKMRQSNIKDDITPAKVNVTDNCDYLLNISAA